MNTADIIILAVLALSVLFGLVRGFVAEVISLVCWIAAFWVAWLFGGAVAAWYGQWLHEPAARIVAGYLTCLLAVVALGSLAGWLIRKLVRAGGLSGGDRFLGMLFGFARGVLLVLVVVWVLAFTPAPRASWWQGSQLLPAFAQGSGWVSRQLPPEVAQYVQNGAGTLPELPRVPISVPRLDLPAGMLPSASSIARPATEPRRDRHHPDGGVGQ
ncbi:MAG TPA: CvpA family protein [Rhodanobacteraceae bacterium]|nr:CvpA family protein [Rhodanobacteraceae bacterium]